MALMRQRIEGEPVIVVMALERARPDCRRKIGQALGQVLLRQRDASATRRRDIASRHDGVGFIIELAQELALPTVPYAGAHSADIRNRQHQQETEHFQRLHSRHEIAHRLGIGDVTALRRVAHDEMVLDEPGHGRRFLA